MTRTTTTSEAKAYHVTAWPWDGGDLVPLADRAADLAVDEMRRLVRRWDVPEDEIDDWLADYLQDDGTEVHLHRTLDEALAYLREFGGCDILEVDLECLEVGQSREPGTDHLTVSGRIPADRLRRIEELAARMDRADSDL